MSVIRRRPRSILCLTFVLLLVWSFRAARSISAQSPSRWMDVSDDARAVGSALLRDFPSAFDAPSRAAVRRALTEFGNSGRQRWLMVSRRTSLSQDRIRDGLDQGDRIAEVAARTMRDALTASPAFIAIPLDGATLPARSLYLPLRSGVLILGRQESPEAAPVFGSRELDLGSQAPYAVELPDAPNQITALRFRNAPEGNSSPTLQLKMGPRAVSLTVALSAPPRRPLHVRMVTETGQPTEAAIGLYSSDADLLVPDVALDFSKGGYRYELTRYRDHLNAGFWPGRDENTRCFFVRGQFKMDLAPGSYRLIVAKGPEFLPVDRNVTVGPDGMADETITLKRWIDMAASGWHSGDCHIHYARSDQEANDRLLLWSQAEDLHLGNVLRMGDGRQTYFEQYAFGKSGRVRKSDFALVPGQEDPRTNVLGHTISLNLESPLRDTRGPYYVYASTFDKARAQGGLSGYAHVNSDSFLVHRDLTMNVPRGKADFAEICEFGAVETDLYYEFLNLGFPLTAVAGSDAPWGGTVGDSRVYAYTGAVFEPDAWFQAVKKGNTFVTGGPMLEFSVDGKRPGEKVERSARQKLKIIARARAGFSAYPLGNLEIVKNGEVIQSSPLTGNKASVEFELPATESMWIAARVRGEGRVSAHTTPVYISVGGKRFWNRQLAPDLLRKRLKILDDLEDVIAADPSGLGVGSPAQWESAEGWNASRNGLRQSIQEARSIYLSMQRELQ